MVKPQAWRDVQTEFDQASTTKDKLQAQLKELEKRVSHLARLNAACTPARQLRQIRQQLQSYADLPMLDEEFFEQVEAVRQKIFSAAHEQRVKQDELRQLKSTLDQLPPVESIWLEHESTIRELVETRGSIQKARKDTPKVQKELLLAKARQQAILDQWKWAPADQSASIPRKLRKELEALQAEWLVLTERKKALTDRAQALARTTARIASEPVDRRETLRQELAKTQAELQTATSLLEADQKIRTLRISQTTLERNVAQAWQKLEPQTLMTQWAEARTLSEQIALLSSTNIPSRRDRTVPRRNRHQARASAHSNCRSRKSTARTVPDARRAATTAHIDSANQARRSGQRAKRTRSALGTIPATTGKRNARPSATDRTGSARAAVNSASRSTG